MPDQSDVLEELRENAADGELPYISKSRVTTYKTCPRKFYLQYILGMRTPGNYYTKRGTQVHKAYELYYENLLEYYEDTGMIPKDLTELLPDDVSLWADWIEPYISNFIMFEEDRRIAAYESAVLAVEEDDELTDLVDEAARIFLPVGIEAEGWDWEQPVPWMGYADVILNAASVPQVDADEGVVIVDVKTGKTPDKKYRDDGIFLEGEYYAMLFENDWNIAAVAGYFPMNNDFLVSELDEERRSRIKTYIEEMSTGKEREDFPINETPLCKWGPEDDQQCDFYAICSSRWGKCGGPGPNYD